MTEPDAPKGWIQANREATAPADKRRACPDAAALAALEKDPQSAPPGVLEHVARCSACSAELQRVRDDGTLAALAAELAAIHDQPDPRNQAPQRRLARWMPMAAAACLVLAVGLGGYLVLDTPRQSSTRSLSTSIEISPRDGAVLGEPPQTMTFSARDDQRYRVLLYDVQAERLWASDPVEAGRVELPGPVRESLGPGIYYWQLQIVDAGTIEGPYAFEVADDHGD
jgi:hypothetical protein